MTPARVTTRIRRCPAFSLVDAIATLTILGAVTVPIATGIASLARGSLLNHRSAAIRTELVYEAERIRALPFASIVIGTTTTSIALPGGSSDLTVTVTLADFDADGSNDSDFELITLTLDGQSIQFYRSNWKT